jgi:transposase, IS5 family
MGQRSFFDVEYQIRDRLSFGRFLGLGIEGAVPDATTVRNFRQRLKELGLIEALFKRFDDYLATEGLHARQGQMFACGTFRPVATTSP